MRNLAIGLGMFVIIAALAFALPQMMPGDKTYYPTTADSSIYDEQQGLVVEPMPETVTVVRRPVLVETETKVIRHPVTRTRIAARRPTLVEKEVEYDDNGRIEEVEYDYDHHYVRNGLRRLGHKIFH